MAVMEVVLALVAPASCLCGLDTGANPVLRRHQNDRDEPWDPARGIATISTQARSVTPPTLHKRRCQRQAAAEGDSAASAACNTAAQPALKLPTARLPTIS